MLPMLELKKLNRFLIEEFTMEADISGVQTLKPLRIEQAFPSNQWEQTWNLARQSMLGPNPTRSIHWHPTACHVWLQWKSGSRSCPFSRPQESDTNTNTSSNSHSWIQLNRRSQILNNLEHWTISLLSLAAKSSKEVHPAHKNQIRHGIKLQTLKRI